MSSQRGNVTRTRAQKYKNKIKFKNDLHDKSPKMKLVNNLDVDNVCFRCKDIIEWKIKFKKYKPLRTPATCVKCYNKSIKHAYHTLCSDCSKALNVCSKCQMDKELVPTVNVKCLEELLKSSCVQEAIKSLPERKRRTLYRHFSKPSTIPTTEEAILRKIREMSVGSICEDLDALTDDLYELEIYENEEN